jgi:hypothetical protein
MKCEICGKKGEMASNSGLQVCPSCSAQLETLAPTTTFSDDESPVDVPYKIDKDWDKYLKPEAPKEVEESSVRSVSRAGPRPPVTLTPEPDPEHGNGLKALFHGRNLLKTIVSVEVLALLCIFVWNLLPGGRLAVSLMILPVLCASVIFLLWKGCPHGNAWFIWDDCADCRAEQTGERQQEEKPTPAPNEEPTVRPRLTEIPGRKTLAKPVEGAGKPKPASSSVTRIPEVGPVPLGDPFVLDFPEEVEERTLDWLLEHAPQAEEVLTALKASPIRVRQGLALAGSLLKQFPDHSTVYAWLATFHIEDGQLAQALAVLGAGLRQCGCKAPLYEVLARISLEKSDLPGVLGWSIKSFVSCRQSNAVASSLVLLSIGSIAGALGQERIANRIAQSLSTRLAPDRQTRLTNLCQASSPSDRKAAEQFLQQLEAAYLQKPGSGKGAPSGKTSPQIQLP